MLPLDGFRPIYTRYNEPIPVPTTDPGAIPGSSITLSCEWWSYVLGAIQHLFDQGVWNTNDPIVMNQALIRVTMLKDLIMAAGNAGDCAGFDISCEYPFTDVQANPWVAQPSDGYPDSAWSVLGLGWAGANADVGPEFSAEVSIRADYIPFTVTAFEVEFGGTPLPCCDPPNAIEFYDHDLNLLATVADTATSTVGFAGPLANVCRIIVRRRADSFAGTLQPTVRTISMTGLAFSAGCEQLVPLADPPHRPVTYWTHTFDFSIDEQGWSLISGHGQYINPYWETLYESGPNEQLLYMFIVFPSNRDLVSVQLTFSAEAPSGCNFNDILRAWPSSDGHGNPSGTEIGGINSPVTGTIDQHNELYSVTWDNVGYLAWTCNGTPDFVAKNYEIVITGVGTDPFI